MPFDYKKNVLCDIAFIMLSDKRSRIFCTFSIILKTKNIPYSLKTILK